MAMARWASAGKLCNPPEIGFLPASPEPPADQDPKLEWLEAVRVKFRSKPETRYRVSIRIDEKHGLFAAIGDLIAGTGDTIGLYYPRTESQPEFRVEEMGGGERVPFSVDSAVELRVRRTVPGRQYRLSFSHTLDAQSFTANPVDERVGTGGRQSWFMDRPAGLSGFFKLEQME